MTVVPWIVTHNGLSTGPCVYECVEHPLGNPPRDFGTAVEQIELYPRCQTRGKVLPSLDEMWDRFQSLRSNPPFVRFRRTRRLVEITYTSDFVYREELFGAVPMKLTPAEFVGLCREFADALMLIRRRLKRSDDFDLAGLEAHLQLRVSQLSHPGLQ